MGKLSIVTSLLAFSVALQAQAGAGPHHAHDHAGLARRFRAQAPPHELEKRADGTVIKIASNGGTTTTPSTGSITTFCNTWKKACLAVCFDNSAQDTHVNIAYLCTLSTTNPGAYDFGCTCETTGRTDETLAYIAALQPSAASPSGSCAASAVGASLSTQTVTVTVPAGTSTKTINGAAVTVSDAVATSTIVKQNVVVKSATIVNSIVATAVKPAKTVTVFKTVTDATATTGTSIVTGSTILGTPKNTTLPNRKRAVDEKLFEESNEGLVLATVSSSSSLLGGQVAFCNLYKLTCSRQCVGRKSKASVRSCSPATGVNDYSLRCQCKNNAILTRTALNAIKLSNSVPDLSVSIITATRTISSGQLQATVSKAGATVTVDYTALTTTQATQTVTSTVTSFASAQTTVKSGTVTVTSTVHATANVAATSTTIIALNPTGVIKASYVANSSVAGYVEATTNDYGSFNLLSSNAITSDTLQVVFLYDKTSKLYRIETLNDDFADSYNYMGAAQGFAAASSDMTAGTTNYNYICVTNPVPYGPAQYTGNSMASDDGTYQPVSESVMWNLDIASRNISAAWTNSNNKLTTPYLFYAGGDSDFFGITGDLSQYTNAYIDPAQQVAWTFVPS
ncbi:uncharacterized protein L969DRAFT_554928 [Mixia osmundae IAM 14324]|uniref:Uncharacterized protein n=1 Tax=Mixia osmundae (strain CBS 9802 / IAM 14324 / JCM 22182 / KY 12970) TaxID=764103 RepID=G7DSP4_MIXOS|nr:uncharacterized protein L969DRAFT_554928 [Mixia osmundae IAM 14324]KEI37899.1 hypothetical protein L969DRAFT_554928 [Mixia osmundae IAM 14324]GAA93604.1 hypothetical protein E5Q_00248 [Mixia osmundae IAM 14324]